MISDKRLEEAMRYLATTDEDYAEAKANVARTEYRCKSVRAQAFLVSEEKTVDARKADAERSKMVSDADEANVQAILVSEKLRAKRTTEALVVEVWRSLQANRRAAA